MFRRPAPRASVLVLLLGWQSAAAAEPRPPAAGTSQPPRAAPQRQVEPFPLDAVALRPDKLGRPTLLQRNRDKFLRGLRATDPDRFLYMFRDAFGQPQPPAARPLGVWDSRAVKLRGHATGHYLSGLAQAYAGAGGDPQLRQELAAKIERVVAALADLARRSGRPATPDGPANADPSTVPPGPGKNGYDSDLTPDGIRNDYWNWGRGFLSAYPPDQFIMLEQGATYGGRDDQVWAPYYTLHKLLAGLLDVYELVGNDEALETARGMGLWTYERLRRVAPATRAAMWDRYIAGEFGGMNEALVRLHRLTGDARFLTAARFFDNVAFFYGDRRRTGGLARNVDTIGGRHANQHVPQVVGLLAAYGATGDPLDYAAAANFWRMGTGSYMYAIGGVAGARNPDNPECFVAEPDTLLSNGFAEGGQNETCATYNLLKLTRDLFAYEPRVAYGDYYERGLYNHILASVAERDAGNTYHVPLNPGARKSFGNAAMDGFTCCNGTALESNTRLQDAIYFRSLDDATLYVNLFVPSALQWRSRNVRIVQETGFPYDDRVRLRIDGAGDFAIKIRIPGWVAGPVELALNGEPVAATCRPGTFATVERSWSPGDVVTWRVPQSLRLERLADRPSIAALFHGPILLAVEEERRLPTWRRIPLSEENLETAVDGDPATLRFCVGDRQLRPFFACYGRYSVYLDTSAE